MENGIWEWLSWSFWTADKSAVVRNFSVGIAGVVGLLFLIWRAVSADKMARAALKQSETAGRQIEIAIQQSEIAAKQSEASSKQSDAAVKQAEASSKQSDAAVKQAEIAQNQQILDIYYRAVSQLGNQHDSVVRTGAVYTLGRIAEDSSRDRKSIVPLLSAYIRKHCHLSNDEKERRLKEKFNNSAPDEKYSEAMRRIPNWRREINYGTVKELSNAINKTGIEKILEEFEIFKKNIINAYDSIPQWQRQIYSYKTSPDVQAAIKVLGSRNRDYEPNPLDLSQVDLRGASFTAANFKDTGLSLSDLSGSTIIFSKFDHCVMVDVNLSGIILNDSSFVKTNLSYSCFFGAFLKGANFSEANLTGCDFRKADMLNALFDGADLSGAQLEDAINLEPSQLENALLDKETTLPKKS